MGIFNYLNQKMGQLNADVAAIEDRARCWPVNMICDALHQSQKLSEKSAYSQLLKQKAASMTDYELKALFQMWMNRRSGMVCNVLLPEMEKRRLAYKDDNGIIHKNY